MNCKAAIVPKMGDPFVVEELELAEPQEFEVRIKVMTCAICHSDIHGVRGEHGAFEGPATAGHEIAGIIDAVGKKVTYVKPGDRVMCCIVRAGCGVCDQCLHDRPWFCENIPPLLFRQPGPYRRSNGEVCIQSASAASGFAEYTNAHETTLCKIDDDIPYAVASALACGFISGFGAVLNRCKARPGESVAVIGCGGVGLSAIQGARVSGACPIIAIDTVESKLDLAKKCGATHTINPTKCDPIEEMHKINKYGSDHTIVAVAAKGIKRQAISLTAPYGQVCVVGHGLPEDEMLGDVCVMEFLAGRRLTGSVMGVVTLRRDMPKYMDMYRHGIIDINCMLTHRFTLDQINEAIYDAEHGALKNVIVIGGE
jgi:S-(hydroxymethyl)glutathione dehydrogenase / alcohol dehydrogenase